MKPGIRMWQSCGMLVHIAAPSAVELRQLRSLLRSQRAEVTPSKSGSLARFGHRKGEQVGAVIAILIGDYEDVAPVLLDIGYCLGREIPLLILTEDERFARLVPTATQIIGGLRNSEALAFHVNTFLFSLESESAQTPVTSRRLLSHADLNSVLSELYTIREKSEPKGPESAGHFEHLVGRLLSLTDAKAFPNESPREGFDFAVSVPGLDFVSGIVAVEAKLASSRQALMASARRLQTVVLERNAGLGVLLYDEGTLQKPASSGIPRVVIVGVERLAYALTQQSLADVLAEAFAEAVQDL